MGISTSKSSAKVDPFTERQAAIIRSTSAPMLNSTVQEPIHTFSLSQSIAERPDTISSINGNKGNHRRNLSDCGVKTTSPSFLTDSIPAHESDRSSQSVDKSADSCKTKSKLVDNVISKLQHPNLFSISKSQFSKHIKPNEVVAICKTASEILLKQPSLLYLEAPINIVGDTHGQFPDLLNIFKSCGSPEDSNYLFLGDYVDRGKKSIETILLLLCYKIKYPNNFFLLRGNHECASINRVYGFYDECKRKYNMKIFKVFTDVFNCLPFAAIVADKIFCVHGGLSPSLQHMNQILMLKRPAEIPDFGLLNDLLWSDPSEDAVEWDENERGVSYKFSKAIVHRFLKKHNLDLICRAHMVVQDGYEFFADRSLVTIFSAPNYCGEFDNKSAVLKVDKNLVCSFIFPS